MANGPPPDAETQRVALFESFLAGYAVVDTLSDDHRDRIRISTILSRLRQLSFWLSPSRGGPPAEFLPRFRTAQLIKLLEDKSAARSR